MKGNVISLKNKKISVEQAKEAVRLLIEFIGEDPERDGLLETPNRVVKSFQEIYSGYMQNPIEALSKTFKNSYNYSDYVLLKDINFTSTCEHHMLPFHGIANIAYIPNDKIVGISKLARIVEIFAKRMQIQENMTIQIANAIHEALTPKGVAVSISAKHMCMCSRGVKKSKAKMFTHHFIGDMSLSNYKLPYLNEIQQK